MFNFKIFLLVISFICLTCVAFGQQGTFIAIGSSGLYSINTNNCTTTPLTSSCSNFAGSALSIGLDGTILYINDNKANLYRITLGPTGTVGDCDSLGKFNSGSSAIYGLTVGPGGIVYAASGNLIETYNPTTKVFGTLGKLPSNLTIGGDLLFYQGTLYEMCSNNNLVAVNMANPTASQVYMQFTAGTIFGLASVTKPCSPNQMFAVSKTGDIYAVDMKNRIQTTTPSCRLNISINDAASIAETESTPPPDPPVAPNPVVYCVNTSAVPLTATVSTSNDILNWYTDASGGAAIPVPTPVVGNTQTTTTYYVSQTDITTGCESDRSPVVVNVDTFSSPTIAIAASATTVCAGAPVTFTASTTRGGTPPLYQWQVNGLNVGADTSIYMNDSLKDGSNISCKLTSNAQCLFTPNAMSNTIAITVNTIDSMPTIKIAASDTSFCPGTFVTFKALPTNGGTAPKFIWRQNGVIVGNSDSIFTTNSLVNGDTITCGLVSNYAACLVTDTIRSNKIRMSVTAKILPTLTIHTDTSVVCSGTVVTFTSVETHGGTPPAYQWRINGNNALNGDSSIFKTAALKNNDVVSCTMISNEACLISNTAQSSITMKVLYTPDSIIVIKTADTNICPGSRTTFIATSPRKLQLDWGVNNVYIEATTNDSFSTSILQDDDTVSCRFITDYGCGTDTIYSNRLAFKVIKDIPPTIVIKTDTTTICTGSSITFSASTTNGGVQPIYQWFISGIKAGTDSAQFTTTDLSDSEKVSCDLTSDIVCLTKKDAVSQPLTITVISPPVVAPIVGGGSVCQGKTTTFTDKSVGGKWASNSISNATIDSLLGIVTGIKSGTSEIVYSIKNSCGINFQSLDVTVVDSPMVYTITGPDSVCINNNINLFEQSTTGKWSSLKETVASVDAASGIVTGLNAGTDSIKYTISNSCGTDYKAKLIYVVGEKAASKYMINQQPTCIAPSSGSITVSISGADKSYFYGINGNLYNSDSAAINLGAGIYEALIYNSLGCIVDSFPIELKLRVDATCDTLYIPTAFIPYGSFYSGRQLRPYGGSSAIRKFSFRVYNRYGNLMYESHDLNKGWDGTVNGVVQEAGAYIWYLDYELFNAPPKEFKGTSVLIR